MRPGATLPVLLVALAAAPAASQIAGERSYAPVGPASPFLPDSRLPGPGIWRELDDLRGDIRRARDNGWLSRREARRLDREARRISSAAARYGRDGLSGSERDELRARSEALRGAVTRP